MVFVFVHHLSVLVCRICLFLLVAGVLFVLVLSSGKVNACSKKSKKYNAFGVLQLLMKGKDTLVTKASSHLVAFMLWC